MNLSPQFGFFELVVVAIVALLVVGPKDLPRLMREAGRWAGKARRMATEFRSAFDQMARETEMEDMRREIDALKRNTAIADVKNAIADAVKPVEDLVRQEANEIRDAVNRPIAAEPAVEPARLSPQVADGERAP